MRKFKIDGVMFEISDSFRSDYKYDVNMLKGDFWVRIGGCNTLASGKELAYEYMD